MNLTERGHQIIAWARDALGSLPDGTAEQSPCVIRVGPVDFRSLRWAFADPYIPTDSEGYTTVMYLFGHRVEEADVPAPMLAPCGTG